MSIPDVFIGETDKNGLKHENEISDFTLMKTIVEKANSRFP